MIQLRRLLVLTLALWSLAVAVAQEVRVDWRDAPRSIRTTDGRVLERPSARGAWLDPANDHLPVLTHRMPVAGDELIDWRIDDMVFEPGPDLADADVPESIDWSVSVARERGQAWAVFIAVPLRRNPSTGRVERLTSFTPVADAVPSPPAPRPKSVANSVLRQGTWHRIGVPSSGIYRIDMEFLTEALGVSPGAVSFSSFGVFGNGIGILPEENAARRPDDLVEQPIDIFDANGNGRFDTGDHVLFFGHGPDRTVLDAAADTFDVVENPYTDLGGYFITPDEGTGRPAPVLPDPGSGAAVVTEFDRIAHVERELNPMELPEPSGRLWVDEQLFPGSSTTSTLTLPNRVAGEPVRLKSTVFGASRSPSSFTVTVNGSTVLTQSIASIGGGTYDDVAASDRRETTVSTTGSTLNVVHTYTASTAQARGWLDCVTALARTRLELVNGRLLFRDMRSVGSGLVDLSVGNASSSTRVWDVTAPDSVRAMTTSLQGGRMVFTTPTDTLRTFVAFEPSADHPAPVSLGTVANQNLHAMGQPDLVVVTHPTLSGEAEALADLHRLEDGMDVVVVTVQEVWNEFASGQQDISAIRDMMKMLYDRAAGPDELPRYLLLFGDASYDYKDRVSDNTNLVPTYQSRNSTGPVQTFATDDYFGFLDDAEGGTINDGGAPDLLDLGIGRIPVRTPAEAAGVVAKIEAYMSPASYGSWRNEICFVADDEDNNLHLNDADEMAEELRVDQPDYNIAKIYLDAFDQVDASAGDRYPDVVDAITRTIRTGSFLINYTGHGGPENWAQERVFNRDDFFDLENLDRLPIFITATCDFSWFDDPGFQSAGEVLINSDRGGSIGMITTVRVVTSFNNKLLNEAVLDHFFDPLPSGEMPRLGDIMRQGKNDVFGNTNNRKFVLLGDPALMPAFPRHEVVTTTVNGQPVSAVDTLRALSRVRIEGEVRDAGGALLTGFDGLVFPTVFDKLEELTTRGNDGGSQPRDYQLRRNILFKGKSSVTDGRFSFEFVVPKDINYRFDAGKLSYYAADAAGERDAAGHSFEVIVGGTADSFALDDIGPEVEVFMNDRSFAFGGLTDESPILLADLRDDNGINTVGNGVGHDITSLLLYTIDGEEVRFELNEFYEADLDSFTSGSVEFPLNDLPEGRHVVTVKAWDVHNNPGEGSTEFVVASSEEVALRHVLNYPNPFTTHTSFIFEHNRPNEPLDVSVQIYTVSGRLVKTLRRQVVADGFRVRTDELTWDGLDDYNDPIGRGVYIYKVRVRAMDGSTAHAFEKLVLFR